MKGLIKIAKKIRCLGVRGPGYVTKNKVVREKKIKFKKDEKKKKKELSLRLHKKGSTHIEKARQMRQLGEIRRCSWFDQQRHHSQRGFLRRKVSVSSPWKRTMIGRCRLDLR